MLSVSLVRDAAGQPLYFISQIADITERKQREQALRDQGEQLAVIASTDPLTGLSTRRTWDLKPSVSGGDRCLRTYTRPLSLDSHAQHWGMV